MMNDLFPSFPHKVDKASEKMRVLYTLIAGLLLLSLTETSAFSSSALSSAVLRGNGLGLVRLHRGSSPRCSAPPASRISLIRCQSGPPLDKEPLDCTEENVELALEEAKQVVFARLYVLACP